LAGSLWGTFAFATALLAPGYLAARSLNILGFRQRGGLEQLAWSVALSFGLGTLPIVALVWAFGVAAMGYLLLALAVLTLLLWLKSRPRISIDTRMALLGIGFTIVVFLSLTDMGIGKHLWMSVTSYDHGIRTEFIDSVLHTGVTPANPLYWPGHAAPMHYYYFWYVTCAVVAQLAHVSARQALIASCIWPFAGILAMLALYARHLLGWQGTHLRQGWWISVSLLAVTGLDLLATIGSHLGGDPLYGDMEWWSIDQVPSWVDSFLWVPHHVAALVCCLLTILLVWFATSAASTSQRLLLAALAGGSFASASGLSTYVALATAITLAAWACWRLLYKDRREAVTAALTTAATAGVLLLPYLVQLLHHGAGEGGRKLITIAVRQIISPTVLTDLSFANGFAVSHSYLALQAAALTLLFPGYIAELGFFLVALLMMQWTSRNRKRSTGESALLFWTWSGLAAATFLRSQVIATNDYGIRATLLPQFFLLLIGAMILRQTAGRVRKGLLLLGAIGVAGSCYQSVMLRVYLPWQERQGSALVRDLGKRNYALRDAYEALDKVIPANARVQFDPSASGYFGYSELLNIHRQTIIDGTQCNASFGGERSACAEIQRKVSQLYASEATNVAANILCRKLDAQYLAADRWDAVWNDRGSWVWSLPVVTERPDVRIVSCGADN
jgi:hypothetical protein